MTHVLIVNANYYPDISTELGLGARETLAKHDVTCEEVMVPGAFEIPPAIRMAIANRKYDGFIALGCVIRGETSHYDYICEQSARGLMGLALAHGISVGYGILTVDTMEQAKERASIKKGNKGKDAAEACLRLIALKNQFSSVG